ncbi:MAG: ABC transporter [Candidatus Rokuibacteriota bacterium]|nr:MAG: ABC transporter [Candidatus Rokubacteria bacterium]
MKRRITSGHSARVVWTHAGILLRVTRNELRTRYAGSLLGAGWLFVYPLVLLAIYAAVYQVIFRVEVPRLTPGQYVLYVFAGLAPFLMMAEALSQSVSSVVSNKFILTSVVFPLDLVVPKAVLLSQGSMIVGVVLIVLTNVVTGHATWTVVLVPVLWALFLVAITGFAWILSLIHVVFRDLQNLLGLVLMVALIASPIAYTPDMVPARLRPLLDLNPFAHFAMAYQQLLVLGELPSLAHAVVIVALAGGLFGLGGWFFGRAKRVFVDYV